MSHNSPQSVTETLVSPAAIAAPKSSASQMVTSFNNNEQRSKSDVDPVEVTRKTSSPTPSPTEQPEASNGKEASVSPPSSSYENEENLKMNKNSADQEIEAEESETNIASEPEKVHAEPSREESPRQSSPKENVQKEEHRLSKNLKIRKKENLEFDPEEDEQVEKSINSSLKERHSTVEEGAEKRTKGSNESVGRESMGPRSSSTSAPPRPPSLPNKSSMF